MSSSAVDSSSDTEGNQSVDDRASLDRLPLRRIIAGQRIWVTGHNRSARRRLEPLLAGAVRPGEGPIDFAFVVPETSKEWSYFAAKALPRLVPGAEVGLVVTDEEAERRDADHPIPQAYHDAAHALGLRREGIWVASSDLLVFRFVAAARFGPS